MYSFQKEYEIDIAALNHVLPPFNATFRFDIQQKCILMLLKKLQHALFTYSMCMSFYILTFSNMLQLSKSFFI